MGLCNPECLRNLISTKESLLRIIAPNIFDKCRRTLQIWMSSDFSYQTDLRSIYHTTWSKQVELIEQFIQPFKLVYSLDSIFHIRSLLSQFS